ncbi:zeta toxin family protein [Methylomicrobium sp. Wu6]|uniref:zeta toxin family protein n=1 Tax=Methylomicrobium sp. Wu6 TaxID=3107928 RepID=UPI002DD6AA71|nr:zeta toxin family protein [Methylomicrobium sp. Wu6]MEC4750600.1 zeta toxin family protein [Methylomicrobium sp. Wu6]
MTHSVLPRIAGYKQLKKLRTVLATARGCVLLSALRQENEATISHDQTKRVTYLTELFSHIHREMYQDWKEQPTVKHRPGSMIDPDKRQKFRKAVAGLVLDDEKCRDTAVFDNNGFVIRTADIAERLAGFYLKMRKIRPFSYGNRITLDFFMTVLGKLPAFKSVYEAGIDFRRLTAEDAKALHNQQSSQADLTLAFEHALDPTRTKSLQNPPNAFGKWPEHKTFVGGIPFLSHRTEDGVDCLVRIDGGLVPLDSVREEDFVAGKHFADFPLRISERVIGYLPGTAELRASDKHEIDGLRLSTNGIAPLFCLDINMLTGLRLPSHTELMELLRQCEGGKTPIFKLANNEALKTRLLIAADGDVRLKRGVEIAYERLGRITAKLEAAKAAIFEGKTPDANPKLFMCMGGAGSGKTAVEEIARAQCGDNFVIASLDEFRKVSDLYLVLTTAGHHSDDYVYVEPFANRLRDMVADHARTFRYNLLYDGTSIPYHPRYANLIKQFKEAGFHTQIAAVDAFIVKPPGREEELFRSGVIDSVKSRFEDTGRALPWVITVYKHIRSPESFLNALEDSALDKLALFANDGERGKHYLVAESFILSDQQVDILREKQRDGGLAEHLHLIIAWRYDSLLNVLSLGDQDRLAGLFARNPAFDESNIAYLIYPVQNGNRVLLIYNTRRMIDFVEKRQLNPHASGAEGLLHKPEALAFHVDPHTQEPWMTRLQGSISG